MAETLIEKDLAKERLEKHLATHKVKIARNAEELYAHSIKDDEGEEIEEFLQTLKEWRSEKSKRSLD